MIRNLYSLVLTFVVLLSGFTSVYATDYYLVGTGRNITLPASWKTISGTVQSSATIFTTSGNVFHIDQTGATISANISFPKLSIEKDFTLGSNRVITCPVVDVLGTSNFILSTSGTLLGVMQFGTLASGSTVTYSRPSGTQTVLKAAYGILAITTSGGIKNIPATEIPISANSLNVTVGTTLTCNAPSFTATNTTVGVSGILTVNAGSAFTSTISLADAATVNLNDNQLSGITFGTLGTGSTVIYGASNLNQSIIPGNYYILGLGGNVSVKTIETGVAVTANSVVRTGTGGGAIELALASGASLTAGLIDFTPSGTAATHLTLNDNTTITGEVIIGGTTTISTPSAGAKTINGNISVTGKLNSTTITNTTINGVLTKDGGAANGNITFSGGTLGGLGLYSTSSGNYIFTNNNITGDFSVYAETGTITLGGSTVLSGGVAVVDISGGAQTIAVSGTAQFNEDLYVSGGVLTFNFNASGATSILGGDVTIGDAATVTLNGLAATTISSGKVFNLNDDAVLNLPTVFVPNFGTLAQSSIINYSSTVAAGQTISPADYGILNVSGGTNRVKTLLGTASAVSINVDPATLTLAAGSSLTGPISAGAGSIVNVTTASDVTFGTLNTTSVVNYNAVDNQNVAAATYGTIGVSGGAYAKTLTGNTAANIISITGATLATGPYTLTGTASLTSSGNAILDIGNTSNNAGLILAVLGTNSTVRYSASADQDIIIANYGRLASTGTGVKSLAGNTSASGNVTIGSPTSLKLNGHKLTASAAFTIASGATLIGSPISELQLDNESTTTLRMDQTSADNRSLNNLTLTAGRTVNLVANNSLDIYGTLDVLASTFTIPTAGTGILTLKSSLSNTARVGDLTGSTFTGNGKVVMERFVQTNGARVYRELGSPIANTTISKWQDDQVYITGAFTGASNPGNGIVSTSSNFRYYNANTAQYVNYPTTNNSAAISLGVGYRIFIRDGDASVPTGNKTIKVQGDIQTGTYNFPIGWNAAGIGVTGGGTGGYNLLSNPHVSAINADITSAGWSRSNIDASIWVFDATAQGYKIKNLTVSEFNQVESGQAFWVRASNSSASLSVAQSAKVAVTGYNLMRTAQSSNLVKIIVNDGTTEERTYLSVNPTTTSGYDTDYDALSLSPNSGANKPFVSTLLESNQMLVNSVPSLNDSSEVKLYVNSTSNKQSRFEFEGLSSYDATQDIYLFDKFNGTYTDLRIHPNYSFTVSAADAATYGSGRFKIVFRKDDTDGSTVTTSVDDTQFDGKVLVVPNPVSNKEFKIIYNGSSLVNVHLYDVLGNVVYTADNADTSRVHRLNDDIQAGVYTLTVVAQDGKSVRTKLIVK